MRNLYENPTFKFYNFEQAKFLLDCLKLNTLHKLFEKSQSGDLEDKKEFVSACNFIGLLTETKDEWEKLKK